MAANRSNNPKFKYAERVSALRPDPNGVAADAVAITGWLGPAATEGHVRVYRTAALDVWAEVAEKDVLSVEPTQSPGLPADMSVVSVRGQATVRLGTNAQREVQADFLTGEIMRAAQNRPPSFWASRGTPIAATPTTATVIPVTETTLILDSYFGWFGACDWVSKKLLWC